MQQQLTRERKRVRLKQGFSVHGATGHNLNLKGCFSMTFEVQGRSFQHPVLVVDKIQAGAIMGNDLLRAQGVEINPGRGSVIFYTNDKKEPDKTALRIRKQVTLPPGQAVWVQALHGATAATVMCQGEQLLEAVGVTAADGSINVLLTNHDLIDRKYKQGEEIGYAVDIDSDDLYSVDSLKVGGANKPENPSKWQFLVETIRHGFHGELANKFWHLIKSYQDIFSLDKYDLGYTDIIQHKVRLKSQQPVHLKQFRLAWSALKTVNDTVTAMQKSGVIEPSRSPYNSPIFCVAKKTGELRVVQDMRALNEASYEDKYAIREISECIDEIGRNHSRIFSTLDMTSGFWQLALDPDSRECTAFTVPGRGRFQWTRCPMGLHGSPSSFARMMDHVFHDAKGTLVYLDDILVHAPDTTTHLVALETAFKRLRKFNLKLNPHKCDFAAKKVPYLGFTLTEKGVQPGEEKLKAVKEFPAPSTIKQVREFCGLANYFRHMVKDYAILGGQLTWLLTKEANWKGPRLPEKAMAAFNQLKQQLCQAPVLTFPRNDRPFTLATDASTGDNASPGGLGSVLTQQDEQGQEKVVAYASRSLRDHEKNYSTFLLEQLAASWAIDHFYVYLKGNRFKLIVDHRPMETLRTIHTKTLNRLQQQMNEYNFFIEYRPGKDNQVADALSRNPVDAINAMGLSNDNLREMQRKDGFCRQYFALFNPQPHEKTVEDAYMARVKNNLEAKADGLLYYNLNRQGHERGQVLVLPKVLHTEILKAAHTSRFAGHGGAEKTTERILRQYWWAKIREDVTKYVANCMTCQKSKNPHGFRKLHAPHQPLPIPDRPGVRVHADLFGPIRASESGKHYLLVITDAWSKL